MKGVEGVEREGKRVEESVRIVRERGEGNREEKRVSKGYMDRVENEE